MDPAFPLQPSQLPDPASTSAYQETVRLPVVEEQLLVGKRIVETGRVVLAKNVSEREETVTTSLHHDEVNVDRVLINRYVDAPPAVRYEGDTMIIPVLEEVVVVEKRLMLVEELHVTKRQIQTQDTRQVTLRREEVTVTRHPAPDDPALQTH